jgi:alkylation response protein AidB-like acyl-CoA dehydrogenase
MLDIAADRTRGHESLLGDLRRLARHIVVLDEDGSFPTQDIARLAAIGALTAPFGGGEVAGIAIGAPDELMEVLRLIGHGSLPLGRLYEGHVNAAALIIRYGTPEQIWRARRRAAEGALFGVWNTEGDDGVRLVREGGALRLAGTKTFASGAGHVACPLITARDADGAWQMVLPQLDDAARADLSDWRAHGMRASATGSFRFSGLAVGPQDLLGGPGDYHRQPHFSAGAWRFCAVQLGGIERLVDEAKDFLQANGRHEDPHQLARMGETLIAAETARLWVRRAAHLAEAAGVADTPEAAERAVAYVNLTRSAVERCGLDTLERVQRSVGLAGFLRTHPLERLCRDLATYLRQPAPDRALCAGAAHAFRDEAAGDLWR